MRGISCLLNFKENFRNNEPYYQLLAGQICSANYNPDSQHTCTFKHATLSAENEENIETKVSEGYQFTVAFSGHLFSYEDQKNQLSAHGYQFLTNNHSELALFSYIHYGEKCAERLSGNFSMIIYDSMRRCVFAFLKGNTLPVFYGAFEDFYIMSSSLKGIFAFPHMPKRLKKDKVLELISVQNRIPEEIFEGIFMLPENTVLKISQKGISKTAISDSPANHIDLNSFPDRIGLISSGSPQDTEFLSQVFCQDPARSVSVYGEKFSDELYDLPVKKQHILIDVGTVSEALKASVTACGFPFLSSFDFLLPISLKQTKGMDEALYFFEPDRLSSYINYTKTLFENRLFHSAVEENLHDFQPKSSIFPPYTKIISDLLGQDVFVPKTNEILQVLRPDYNSQKLKAVLRRILLDIISKEHSPIFAFFNRSALLRLCEGGFIFHDSESVLELTAYLIKLNLWFEIFSPSII